MICQNCIHSEVCKYKSESVYECVLYCDYIKANRCEHFKDGTIKNQYDRIKNMSVEELAEGIQVFLAVHLNKYGNAMGLDTVFLTAEEKQCTINEWKKWLESEVTE